MMSRPKSEEDVRFAAALAAERGEPQPVMVSTVAHYDAGPPLSVWLYWEPADPFAALLTFQSGKDYYVTWTVARELLASGLTEVSGDLDVRIEPWLDYGLLITLDNHLTRPATFLFQAAVISDFLADTYRQVTLGSERVEVPSPEAIIAGGAR